MEGFDCHTIACDTSGQFKVSGSPAVSSGVPTTGGLEPITGYRDGYGTFYGNAYTAVSLYCSDPASAISTYGPIEDWDMGGIWDFEGLFRCVCVCQAM